MLSFFKFILSDKNCFVIPNLIDIEKHVTSSNKLLTLTPNGCFPPEFPYPPGLTEKCMRPQDDFFPPFKKCGTPISSAP